MEGLVSMIHLLLESGAELQRYCAQVLQEIAGGRGFVKLVQVVFDHGTHLDSNDGEEHNL